MIEVRVIEAGDCFASHFSGVVSPVVVDVLPDAADDDVVDGE